MENNKGTEITDHSNIGPQLGKLVEKIALIKKIANEDISDEDLGKRIRILLKDKII